MDEQTYTVTDAQLLSAFFCGMTSGVGTFLGNAGSFGPGVAADVARAHSSMLADRALADPGLRAEMLEAIHKSMTGQPGESHWVRSS